MFDFFSQNLPTIIAGTVVFAVVAAAAVKLVLDKVRGKSSCGCACSGCPNAGLCHSKTAKNETK